MARERGGQGELLGRRAQDFLDRGEWGWKDGAIQSIMYHLDIPNGSSASIRNVLDDIVWYDASHVEYTGEQAQSEAYFRVVEGCGSCTQLAAAARSASLSAALSFLPVDMRAWPLKCKNLFISRRGSRRVPFNRVNAHTGWVSILLKLY